MPFAGHLDFSVTTKSTTAQRSVLNNSASSCIWLVLDELDFDLVLYPPRHTPRSVTNVLSV